MRGDHGEPSPEKRTMRDDIPLTRRDFEQALSGLQKEHRGQAKNPGSHGCEDCTRCYHCMFTTGSEDCFFCTYCSDCTGCSRCTQCRGCENCHASSYCVQCRNCSDSSYLILSEDCAECVFCFGCVGLVKKEFHILNKPFTRQEYFELVGELKATLGIDTR